MTLTHSEDEDNPSASKYDLYSSHTHVISFQLGKGEQACIVKVIIYTRDRDSDLLAYHDII